MTGKIRRESFIVVGAGFGGRLRAFAARYERLALHEEGIMQAEKIDLNQADVTTLTTLPGIGEALARRIVHYRETVHPFEEVIELAAVPGISERMVRALADRVVVVPSDGNAGQAEVPVGEGEAEAILLDEMEIEPEPAVAVPELVSTETEVEEEVGNPMTAREDDIETTPLSKEPARRVGVYPVEPAEEAAPPPTSRRVEPQAAAPPPPESSTTQARRGCLFITLGAILGAFVGTIFTLAILAALNNGTLAFSQRDAQLSRELEDARRTQSELETQLEELTSQLEREFETVNSSVGAVATQQAASDQSLEDVRAELATTEADIVLLEETAGDLDERISTVASAAENFDAFLDSLRDLLVEFQGAPPTPTVTPTVIVTATATDTGSQRTFTPTPIRGTATPTPIVTPIGTTTIVTPTESALPTRTPRPTATPFVMPTRTPQQQP